MRKAKSLFFCARLQPGIPNDGDHLLSLSFIPPAPAYCFRVYMISSIFISFSPW